MNQKTAIIVGGSLLLILLILGYLFFTPSSKSENLDFYIFDSNNNNHYEVGEPLEFTISDSTMVKSHQIVWKFGNGDMAKGKNSVKYDYKSAGKYLITLEVGKNNKVSKYIKVIPTEQKQALDSIPRLLGPDIGYVGEELVFYAEGPGAKIWYWEFGESGTVDAYEQQTVYAYSEPGIYKVKLSTNTTAFPIFHEIEILPQFEKVDDLITVDSLALAEDDIKKHLQSIANTEVGDRNNFYKQLNYIKQRYICHDLSEVVVVINQNKYNDLYSYCQGLHYLEAKKKQKVNITKVEIDTFNCVKRINVSQNGVE